MDLTEIGIEDMDWIHQAQNRGQWRAVLNMIWTFGFHRRQGIY
jgi:hypothetical protein